MRPRLPDMYEIGMSYLGQKILSECINAHPQFWAERVFTPCVETAAILREHNTPLATLESDTPLGEMDVVGISLTHELCYTNVLFLLDLANIPFRSADRDESHPLIIAGGGATFNAEPVAPFFDAMVIGDGEEAMPGVLACVEKAKEDGLSRDELLRSLINVPGIYIPSFFEDQGAGQPLKPLIEGYESIDKAVVDDLNKINFPKGQTIPFNAVHDRLTMEIARGCTRGCRFCQAGMIYRPVRERSLDNLDEILTEGLAKTGYEETSMLSLSTGDFSALDTFFTQSFDKCASEQIAISLPSLRVGSLSEPIMERISSIRRTGATLAPGSRQPAVARRHQQGHQRGRTHRTCPPVVRQRLARRQTLLHDRPADRDGRRSRRHRRSLSQGARLRRTALEKIAGLGSGIAFRAQAADTVPVGTAKHI